MQIKDVTDELRYDLNWPSLDKHNPTFVANCVKRFLHKLEVFRLSPQKNILMFFFHPLIPKENLNDFLNWIIKSSDEGKFTRALKLITRAERDTLAHVMNHLQKVRTVSNAIKLASK